MYGLNVIAPFLSYSFASRSCSVGIFTVLKAMHCSNGEFLQCLRFTTMAKLKQYQFKRRGQFFCGISSLVPFEKFTHIWALQFFFSEFLLTLSSNFTSLFFSLILTGFARSHFQTERIFFLRYLWCSNYGFEVKIMSVAKPRA